jgi:FlaA1/EpsC-like NDP-sugar epimerase
MLLAADVVGLLAAFFATELIFLGNQLIDNVGIGEESLIFVLALPIWIVAAKLYGLYDRDEERATHSTADEVVSVFHLITVGVWLFYATSWLVGFSKPDQAKLATFWFFALLGVAGMRSAARTLARRHRAYIRTPWSSVRVTSVS